MNRRKRIQRMEHFRAQRFLTAPEANRLIDALLRAVAENCDQQTTEDITREITELVTFAAEGKWDEIRNRAHATY